MTEVCQDGSKHPSWGTALNFQAQNNVLGVEVWDKDVLTADNLVGEGVVQIGHINPGSSAAVMCELRYQGRPAGFVNLNVEYNMGMGMGMGGMGMGGMGMGGMGMGGMNMNVGGFGGGGFNNNPFGGGGFNNNPYGGNQGW